jgi:hypothetical protein
MASQQCWKKEANLLLSGGQQPTNGFCRLALARQQLDYISFSLHDGWALLREELS